MQCSCQKLKHIFLASFGFVSFYILLYVIQSIYILDKFCATVLQDYDSHCLCDSMTVIRLNRVILCKIHEKNAKKNMKTWTLMGDERWGWGY